MEYNMNLGEIRALLKKYNQEQLLNGYEKLDERKQKELLQQIQNIDFELMNSLYLTTKQEQKQQNDEITPMEYMDKYKLYDDYKYYDNIGKKAIREGKLAAVTMAGGQGTRLGHNGPKGTFDFGLSSHKTIFEVLCEKLKDAYKKYNIYIPWYIMTSKENNSDTIKFFENNKYVVMPPAVPGRCFGKWQVLCMKILSMLLR